MNFSTQVTFDDFGSVNINFVHFLLRNCMCVRACVCVCERERERDNQCGEVDIAVELGAGAKQRASSVNCKSMGTRR